jgi:hypothetical protein
MRCFKIVFVGLGAGMLLAFQVCAQDATTNAPATIIENFELQTDTVIVKGFNLIGTISIGNSAISVRAKVSNDINHGQKVFGIAIGWSGSDENGSVIPKGSMDIDYDELDAFISGISYIGNVTYDATSLPAFEASFTTKSGLRVIAHSDRRQGGINTFLQFGDWQKIPLTSDQLAQLKSLVTQAKVALDTLK